MSYATEFSLDISRPFVPFDVSQFQSAARLGVAGVKPIWATLDGGRRAQIGTACVIELLGRRVLITAEHVLEGPQPKSIGVSEVESMKLPSKYTVLRSTQAGIPHPDIAFVVLPADGTLHDARFAPLVMHPLATKFRAGSPTSLLAAGFPGSRADFILSQNQLSNEMMFVSGETLPSSTTIGDIARDGTHLEVRFDRKKSTSPSGAPTVAAEPDGMSGGALLLAIEQSRADGSIHQFLALAGILVSYRRPPINTLVVVRIDAILSALSSGESSSGSPFVLRPS